MYSEKEMVHRAHVNSLCIICKEFSYEDIAIFFDGELLLAHDPMEEISKESIQRLIDYFKKIEMYEECELLTNSLTNLKKINDRIKKLSEIYPEEGDDNFI